MGPWHTDATRDRSQDRDTRSGKGCASFQDGFDAPSWLRYLGPLFTSRRQVPGHTFASSAWTSPSRSRAGSFHEHSERHRGPHVGRRPDTRPNGNGTSGTTTPLRPGYRPARIAGLGHR